MGAEAFPVDVRALRHDPGPSGSKACPRGASLSMIWA